MTIQYGQAAAAKLQKQWDVKGLEKATISKSYVVQVNGSKRLEWVAELRDGRFVSLGQTIPEAEAWIRNIQGSATR